MAHLIPPGLASKAERERASPADLAQAAALKRRAKALGKSVTRRGWLVARQNLGKAFRGVRSTCGRRAVALQLIAAATGYRPLPKQLALHLADNADRIDKFFCGGIGTGKSTSAVVEDMICMLCNPGTRALIVAPTYDQALHVLLPIFLAFCELMERAGYPLLRKFYWSQMRAELIDGGEVFFRSVSKIGNLLGFQFATIHLDESETIANPELVWETLTGRCRQLANFRQMLGTSTPRGPRGVIGIFQNAREKYDTLEEREKLRSRYFFVRATTLENPHLPPDYIESLQRTFSKAGWDQEVLAKILRPEAAVYSEFDRARHEFAWRDGKAKFIAHLAKAGVEYDVVYDPGQTYAHVLWIARFADMDVVFDEICEDNITVDRLHADIIARCSALARPPTGFVLDRAVKRERAWAWETFPQSQIMICESRTEQSIVEGISVVKTLLDPMVGEPRLRFASFLWDRMARRAIIKCMMHYSYDKQASGLLSRLPRKDNAYDHGADGVRMWAMKRHGEAYRFLVVQRRHAA